MGNQSNIMKNVILLLSLVLILSSCKEENKAPQQGDATTEKTITADDKEKTAKQSDGLTLLKGDYVFYDNAAVLQTHKEFYGVIINDKTHELNTMVKQYKSDDTDMIPVEVRGRITDKDDPVIKWTYKVEIVEILNVSEPKKDANETIKLGTK